MEKKTALSAAGALAMTSAAAVSALFLTIGQGVSAAPEPAAPQAPEIVTEYQFVQVDPDQGAAATTTTSTEAPVAVQRTVYEIEYVQEAPAAAVYSGEYDVEYEEDDDHDEYEDEEHEEEEDDEDDDD